MAEQKSLSERVWLFYWNENGFYIFRNRTDAPGGELKKLISGDALRGTRYIPFADGDAAIDDKTSSEIKQAVGADAEGVFIPVVRDVPAVVNYWRRLLLRKQECPMVFFKKTEMRREAASYIMAHCCEDAVFLDEIIPGGNREAFRSSRSCFAAVNARGMLPILSKFDAAYRKWRAAKNVILSKDNIFIHSGYVNTAETAKVLKEDISTEKKSGPYLCIVIYNLGIDTDSIRFLQDKVGFVWNRNMMAWTALASRIDRTRFQSFISEFSLPSPEQLQFVPEWLARREEIKALGRIKRTGSFSAAAKNRSSYEDAIRFIMGA